MIRSNLKIKMIKTDNIFPNPYQVRKNFDAKELSNLCESIKEVGIIYPIVVRGISNGYELICGQRRLRAAIMADMKEIPALIVKAGDAQCAQISLIENIQRSNLKRAEEAEGYYNLMAYHKVKKEKLLKSLSANGFQISEKIKILKLSEKVRYKIEENNIPENIIKELLRLHDEEKQLETIEKIASGEILQTQAPDYVNGSIKEMIKGKREKSIKREYLKGKFPVYINTVKKTIELLNKSGAQTELLQTENEQFYEFNLKIFK